MKVCDLVNILKKFHEEDDVFIQAGGYLLMVRQFEIIKNKDGLTFTEWKDNPILIQ